MQELRTFFFFYHFEKLPHKSRIIRHALKIKGWVFMFSCFYKLISTPYQSDLHAYTILKTLRKSEFTKIKIHIKPEKRMSLYT